MTVWKHSILAAAVAAVSLGAPSIASASGDFTGPSGWSHTDVASPSATRKIMQWHIAGDPTTSVTFIDDSTASYGDAVNTVTKNFTDNNIKPATNKDVPCRGGTAHVVEFTFGPDGSKTIINRMIVPDGQGVATITYTRGDGNAFDDDVRKAETAYCAP